MSWGGVSRTNLSHHQIQGEAKIGAKDHIVQKRWSKSNSKTGLTRVFAYGANLSISTLRSRCPSSQLGPTAVLRHHRFRIDGAGVATIAHAPHYSVHGLIWLLNNHDLRRLDWFEGLQIGCYVRRAKPIKCTNRWQICQVYVSNNQDIAPPRPGYLGQILRSAISLGFPSDYVAELEGWM